jgi:hypothetical protein
MADIDTATNATPNAGGEAGQPAAAAQARTFTQDELDTIVSERLSREKAKYQDYHALKTFKETAEAANKSEFEKLTDRAEKAEAKARDAQERYLARTLDAEARAVAATLGFQKPDKAVKLADLTKAVNDGEVDADAITAAMSALASEMPELLKPMPARVGATNPTKGSETEGKENDAERWSRLRGGGGSFLQKGNLVMYKDQ